MVRFPARPAGHPGYPPPPVHATRGAEIGSELRRALTPALRASQSSPGTLCREAPVASTTTPHAVPPAAARASKEARDGTVCFIPRDIFGLRELKSDVKRPLAASTRRAPGRSPLRRAARAWVARASDRHRSPLRALCPRTADAQARGRARAMAMRTPPSTRARSRTSPVTLYSEQRRCACTPFPRHMHFGGRK